MKNLRTILVFTCLGYASLVRPELNAQSQPSPEKISSGTYAIIHHPVSGAVRLVDLFAPDRHRQLSANPNGPYVQLPEHASASGHATLAYDGRRSQLVLAGFVSKGAALWRHKLASRDVEQIGDITMPPGHMFTKMAAGPDGHIYALTTPVRSVSGKSDQRCTLVRITPGPKGHPASTRTVAVLSGSNGFHAALMYSGDMAFSAAGDLYIFGTAIDTTIRYYTGSEVFRIPVAALRAASGAVVPVERLGPIRGMGTVPGYDSTVISGAAFLPDGRFLLSALDKATQQSAFLYVGRFLPEGISVEPVTIEPGTVPQGFLITDLASGHFPALSPIRKIHPVSTALQLPATQPDDWQQFVTIRTYQY